MVFVKKLVHFFFDTEENQEGKIKVECLFF